MLASPEPAAGTACAEDATPAARPAPPVSATPVPLLALDTFGSSYSQRSSLSSISGSDACSTQRSTNSVQQKQARLRTARQRQLEQRREGVAALMLLHSSLQRACAACRALQRWRRFAEADAPNPPALLSPAALPATPRTDGGVVPQSPSSQGVSPERHAEVLAGLQASAEALEQAEARARAERRLLRAELRAETLERLDHAQRQHQSDLLAHVYEKQAAAAAHQKALQQAELANARCPNAQCPMPNATSALTITLTQALTLALALALALAPTLH